MNKYNRLGVVRYNQLGRIKYNSRGARKVKPLFNRLAQARPVVLDQNRRRLAVLENAEEIILSQRTGAEEDTLTFEIPFNDPKRKYIENENIIQLVDQEYYIRTVTDIEREGEGTVTSVYCEAIWYDLRKSDPLEVTVWEDATPREVMEDVLAGTEWSVGRVEIVNGRNLQVDEDLNNRLRVLHEVAEVWGGELQFDVRNREVNLMRDEGEPIGVAVVKGKNMREIEVNWSTEDLYTRIYPYGRNRMTIEDANDGVPYVENYQFTDRVLVLSFMDERFTNPFHLKQKAEEILEQLSKPRPNFVIKAADLSEMSGLSHEKFKLGGRIRVYHEELGVEVETRILYWDYNVKEPWETVIELSAVQPGLSDLLSDLENVTYGLRSEDTVDRQDMMELMVFNYLLNSRAEDGFNYWQNDGFEIDANNGVSSNTSFKCVGEFGVTKRMSQVVYPSDRNQFTISFQASAENVEVRSGGRVGVEITIEYDDGSKEKTFIPLVQG
mgnify:CR=1 FL=1